jgi:hypothetical protein
MINDSHVMPEKITPPASPLQLLRMADAQLGFQERKDESPDPNPKMASVFIAICLSKRIQSKIPSSPHNAAWKQSAGCVL